MGMSINAHSRRLLILTLVVILCIALDQATKVIARATLATAEPLIFAGGLARLAYAENPGAFLSLGADLPPFHYMIAVAGGRTIRCAPYALFGTQALSDRALVALEGRKACLLANHGMIALGRDLDEALAISIEVESLCEMYWRASQIGTFSWPTTRTRTVAHSPGSPGARHLEAPARPSDTTTHHDCQPNPGQSPPMRKKAQ